MSLGENIHRLRSAKNMSQGDLAEALDVSRQSISKWETDGATPELDKLVKLAELFGVTLDELVAGKAPEREESPKSDRPPQIIVERRGMEGRKVAGIILLCMAFVTVLLCTVMGGLLTGLVLCLPLLACGVICFTAKKHPGLWCCWALFFMVDGYLRYATGLNWSVVRWTFQWTVRDNYIRLAVGWGQFLCGLGLLAGTVFKLRKGQWAWTKGNKTLFAAGIVAFALLSLPFGSWIFQVSGVAYVLSVANALTLLGFVQDSLRLGLLAFLLTALIRSRKQKN